MSDIAILERCFYATNDVSNKHLSPIYTQITGITETYSCTCQCFPDSKVRVANMGPIWGRQDPGGPHVGPMNFAIWVCNLYMTETNQNP